MSLIDVKKKLLMVQKGGTDVSELFNISLWTGNSAARTITTGIDSGEGSLVWIKARSGGGEDHVLADTARGAGLSLSTNSADAQSSVAGRITSFSASAYDLGTNGYVNFSGYNYVGWQFRRAEKFFDIVQYTGNGVARQIAHNLGVAPGMLIVKRTSSAGNWLVQHISRPASQLGLLNSTNAFSAGGDWNSTAANESNFTVSAGNSANQNGEQYIAYLFAHDPSPEGIIQCGSYVGNGSATGPVVNLGWRPQYLMIKSATGSSPWQIYDTKRLTGANDLMLEANSSSVESDQANALVYQPNGFQINVTYSNLNSSGQTYIYMAIREAA